MMLATNILLKVNNVLLSVCQKSRWHFNHGYLHTLQSSQIKAGQYKHTALALFSTHSSQ